MYTWEIAPEAQPQFDVLPAAAKRILAEFMDAAVVAGPMEFLCGKDEHAGALRTLPFGPHQEGIVTFLVYVQGDLVLVVQIQWHGPVG
jgi:hypothetical protein